MKTGSIVTLALLASPLAASAKLGRNLDIVVAPDLRSCNRFALHGHAGVAAAGDMTVVYGDVGGENAITGFGTGPPLPHLYDGPIAYQFFSAAQSASTSCFGDKQLAYDEAKGATCTDNTTPTDLGGKTIYPGVHCNTAGFFELTAGELTLDGQDLDDPVFIFQTAMGVSTSAHTDIKLVRGAKAKNVYWQTGTLINLAGDSTFRGNLLAGSSIALGARTVLSGRALAVTESVTLAGTNSVSTPDLTVNDGSPDE